MTDIGDLIRFGNPLEDPTTGEDILDPVTGEPISDPFTLNGAATDPTAVFLLIQRPDGTQLQYGWPSAGVDGTLTRESAGRFYAQVEIDQAGKWRYLMRGTGAVVASSESFLRVEPRRVIS